MHEVNAYIRHASDAPAEGRGLRMNLSVKYGYNRPSDRVEEVKESHGCCIGDKKVHTILCLAMHKYIHFKHFSPIYFLYLKIDKVMHKLQNCHVCRTDNHVYVPIVMIWWQQTERNPR